MTSPAQVRPGAAPSPARWSRPGFGLAVLGVLALASVLFAVPAGRRPFWSSDEARFALLAQDILSHGRWLVPELRGQLYLNKPQLYFWSIALTSLPAGRVTEATAALPSVLSAVATVAAVVAIGRLVWGAAAGLLAGLVLATTPMYFVFAHQVLADVMMTAWMTWALYFYLRAARDGGRAGSVVAFYLCVGAAVLSKGPAGLAGLAGVLLAAALTEGAAGLRRLRPAWGLGLLLLLALPWLVPYLVESRGHFTDAVLLGHYRTWYFGGDFASRLRNLVRIPLNFLPWAAFLAGAAAWWRWSPDPGRRRIALVTLTVAVVLSFSGVHRARYELPVYPGLALLTAEFLARGGADRRGRALLRAGAVGFALVTVTIAVAAALRFDGVTGEDRAFLPDGPGEAALLALLAGLAGLAALLTAWSQRYRSGAAASAVAVGALLLAQALTYPPRYARANDVRALAEAAARHAPPGAVVVGHPDLRLSYDFYLRRRVVEAPTPSAVARLLRERPRAVIITSRERWGALAPVLPGDWRVLASGTVGDREMVVVGSDAS